MRWLVLLALAAMATVLSVRGDDGDSAESFSLDRAAEEAAAAPSHSEATKNSDAVQKRRARADAKAKYEDENGASFDAFGRVIRYGMTADDLECKRAKAPKGSPDGVKGGWGCKVTAFTRRKYLTKEEKVVSKQMQAEKQEELDSAFGGAGAETMMKKNK